MQIARSLHKLQAQGALHVAVTDDMACCFTQRVCQTLFQTKFVGFRASGTVPRSFVFEPLLRRPVPRPLSMLGQLQRRLQYRLECVCHALLGQLTESKPEGVAQEMIIDTGLLLTLSLTMRISLRPSGEPGYEAERRCTGHLCSNYQGQA